MKNKDVPVTRSKLESLSTDELIKIADSHGIDIPPGLERIFIIEEVLEITNAEIPQTEDIEVNPEYSDTVPLPKQYNISFIDVIIRDPLWVFVFWEVKGQERETYEKDGNFNGYLLRIIQLNEDGSERITNEEDAFTLTVSADDNARYIGFAEQRTQGHSCYVIKLTAVIGENEHIIAVSAPFALPKLMTVQHEENENHLLRLSGIRDLLIVKNTERQSRGKRL